MTVNRHGVADGAPGKLLAVFASLRRVPFGPDSMAYNHWLAQWNPANLAYRPGAEAVAEPTMLDAIQDDWAGPYPLRSCALSPMTELSAMGRLQWGILPRADSVWVGCQASRWSPSVVRVELDAAGTPTYQEDSYPLWVTPSVPLTPPSDTAAFPADVMVDPVGGRLVFRTYVGYPRGDGVIVFDTHTRSPSAPTFFTEGYATAMALGLNEATGTLYALMPDHQVWPDQAVQGGLLALSTREESATVTNVRPDLDYPAFLRIQVDPVTSRFFVRRGDPGHPQKAEYPGTALDTPAPVEPFYRVFVDKAA